MSSYKVYFMGRASRIEQSQDIHAENDAQAIRKAVQLFDGRPMELWEEGRVVRRFGSF